MKKVILVVALAVVGYALFSLGSIKAGADFKGKLDSLDRLNDSLATMNMIDDKKIDELKSRDSILEYEVSHQKTRVIKIDHWIDSSKSKIDTYTEHELVSSFNQRYPKDTTTNPLPLAQPVLIATAKDLVELDGAKIKLTIKDSIISIQENRITLKDSTIVLFQGKESRYKAIISNQDLKINEWSKQYDIISLQNKKLKLQSKFLRIGTGVVVAGLIYTAVHK